MKNNKTILNIFLLTVFVPGLSLAKTTVELLEQPAIVSHLAIQSVLTAITATTDSVIVLGERGHILTKQKNAPPANGDSWLQHSVPVSVTLTAVTVLSDGTKIVVGHDSVILVSDAGSKIWKKVFTGHDLLKQKKRFFERQIDQLKKALANTLARSSGDIEELEYQLEDLNFALQDVEAEQLAGPNKPLLSITATANDILFATGAYGTLLTSSDKGQSWQLIEQRLINPDKYHLNSIIYAAGRLYIVGENGLGFRSDDQGATWSEMNMPYAGSLFGLISNASNNTFNTNTSNARTAPKAIQLVAFGLQGNIMVSLDGGESWRHNNIGFSASLLGGAITLTNQVYLVGHGGIVIDFNIESIDQLHIRKHLSGSAFSAVIVDNDSLILAGQFGIVDWDL